jgi:hypothetical protein
METEKYKIVSFLHDRSSQETFAEYSKYFENSSHEDLIHSLATYIWDSAHGDAPDLVKIMLDVKNNFPLYFADVMQAAITGNHDT